MLPLISVVDFTRSSQYDQRVGACLTFVCFWNFNACTVYWKKCSRDCVSLMTWQTCVPTIHYSYIFQDTWWSIQHPHATCMQIYILQNMRTQDYFRLFFFSLFSCTTVTRDSKAIIDQPRRHSSAQNPADPFSRLRWSHSKASSPAN